MKLRSVTAHSSSSAQKERFTLGVSCTHLGCQGTGPIWKEELLLFCHVEIQSWCTFCTQNIHCSLKLVSDQYKMRTKLYSERFLSVLSILFRIFLYSCSLVSIPISILNNLTVYSFTPTQILISYQKTDSTVAGLNPKIAVSG